MSKRPGIAAGAAIKIAESLQEVSNFSEAFFGISGDVPSLFVTDGKRQPVGRYLKSVMRKTLGWTDPQKCPEGALNEWKKTLQELYSQNGCSSKDTDAARFQKKMLLIDENRDAITCIESKFKKFNLRGAL